MKIEIRSLLTKIDAKFSFFVNKINISKYFVSDLKMTNYFSNNYNST